MARLVNPDNTDRSKSATWRHGQTAIRAVPCLHFRYILAFLTSATTIHATTNMDANLAVICGLTFVIHHTGILAYWHTGICGTHCGCQDWAYCNGPDPVQFADIGVTHFELFSGTVSREAHRNCQLNFGFAFIVGLSLDSGFSGFGNSLGSLFRSECSAALRSRRWAPASS